LDYKLTVVFGPRDACVLEKLNHALVIVDRERCGREAILSAGIADIESVKTTEAGGPRGYDAGKKIKGRKRIALVDIEGRAPAAVASGELPRSWRQLPMLPRSAPSWLSSPVSVAYDHNRVVEAPNIPSPDRAHECLPDRLRRSPAPVVGRTFLSMDQGQPKAREGL
jgi:hypothetical protein